MHGPTNPKHKINQITKEDRQFTYYVKQTRSCNRCCCGKAM